jgi:hypothetical protein
MNRSASWATKLLGAAAVAAVLLGMGRPVFADTSFSFDVETHYSFTLPPGCLQPFGAPSPDTGYWVVRNSGKSTFTGTVGQIAVTPFGVNYDATSPSLTLTPGQTVAVAVNFEASNQGGYNGPVTSPQNGVEILIDGMVSDPSGSSPVHISVFDKDIHSGVPRTNPFGTTLDNYVLQGGDPFGRDTGDAFETTQARGFANFSRGAAVPEPSTLLLLLTGAAVAGVSRLRKKR